MTLGLAERQGRLGNVAVQRCEAGLPERSIYRLLHAERDRLFPDELFADLYVQHGRRSVPPSILAVVMVLQRLEGCSDREAVDRFAYDLRWRYAAGVDDEVGSFAHTVLVELRARLRASADPDRVFRVTTELARQAGLVGVRRVLDSAPLFDAVATCDTVTLVRGGIRGLLRALPVELAATVRAALVRDDDYQQPGKPVCDWDDPAAREQLVDALFRDGYRALHALRGIPLGPDAAKAAELLATVIGQDIEETDDGRFIIAKGVAPDRVLSLVDPQARHGHKTSAHGFDGYKGHIAADPDSEIITAAEVGPGNTGDAAMAAALLADLPAPSGQDATPDRLPSAPASQPAPTHPHQPPTGTAPTAPARCWPTWRGGAWWRCSRWRRRPPPMGGTPRTGSPSTWTLRRSPAPPGSPWRSSRAVVGAGWPASAAPAPSARSPAGAPAAAPVARSASTPTRRCSLEPASGSGIPPGGPTTARTAPRSNASSRTCSAAATAGGAPAYVGCCGSGRTGGCWPPRSTSPAWPCSACTPNQVGGRWHRRSSHRGNRSRIPPTRRARPPSPTTSPRAIRSALVTPH
jgi:Transposase domain (DUF772)/Transposase DDE domain